MHVIDPGVPEDWPADVRAVVEQLADRCRANSENGSETPAYGLRLEHVDDVDHAEVQFRELLGSRYVALFHATRLLPHEEEAVRREGLVTLSGEHRNARLDQVISIYGKALGADRLETLRHAGPLTWKAPRRSARLGVLHGVTPLRDSFAEAGDGIRVFLESWGGESFYWAGKETDELSEAIGALTKRSRPIIVELAVTPGTLNTFAHLWQVFVAQLQRRKSAWQEFQSTESIPPERVIAMIDESSTKWPPELGPLRAH